MTSDNDPRPGRDDYDWEEFPTLSEAEMKTAADASQAKQDEATERALRTMTEDERREKLWAWFAAEGANAVEFSADGIESTPIQPGIVDVMGYRFGYTPAEVRVERFEWQEAQR